MSPNYQTASSAKASFLPGKDLDRSFPPSPHCICDCGKKYGDSANHDPRSVFKPAWNTRKRKGGGCLRLGWGNSRRGSDRRCTGGLDLRSQANSGDLKCRHITHHRFSDCLFNAQTLRQARTGESMGGRRLECHSRRVHHGKISDWVWQLQLQCVGTAVGQMVDVLKQGVARPDGEIRGE